MKYLRGRLIIAKHILLSIAAFGHRLKLIARIFTDLLTWVWFYHDCFRENTTRVWVVSAKQRFLWSLQLTENIILSHNHWTLIVKSHGVARKREKKKKSRARKFGAFSVRMSQASGCPWRQDSRDELSRVRMSRIAPPQPPLRWSVCRVDVRSAWETTPMFIKTLPTSMLLIVSLFYDYYFEVRLF